MSKISGQLLISGQFQDICDISGISGISGQLGALYSAPVEERSIVMSMSVCLSAIHMHTQEIRARTSSNIHTSVVQTFSGSVTIRYVYPVLWVFFP